MRPTVPSSLVLLFVLLCLPFAAVIALIDQPPSPLSADAPASQFSAVRALAHVRAIARAPHALGSAEHDQVRDYLLDELRRLGLSPEVQTAYAVDAALARWRPNQIFSGRVENILARMPGSSGNGKSILLMSHYDSVPSGPGAGDDAHGVATVLETTRALRAGPQPANDIAVVITDGEEAGLLGAQAFASSHPWRKSAGIILNLDARGNSGPAALTRIAESNGAMARTYASSVPYPTAFSLTTEVYKLVPAATDVQAFYPYAIPSMDFAIFKGVMYYHSGADTPENLDLRSVQQQGANLLALARKLGDSDLTKVVEKDAIFFSLPGNTIIVYPLVWGVLTGIAAAVLSAFLPIWALQQRQIRLRGLLPGLAAVLLAMAAAPALTAWLWPALSIQYANRNGTLWHDFYKGEPWLLAAIFGMALAGLLAVVRLFRRWADESHFLAAALLLNVPLTLAAVLVAPAASYVMTWPAFGLALAFYAAVLRPGRFTLPLLIVAAVPPLVMIPPLAYLMLLVLNVRQVWILSTIAMLTLMSVAPQVLFAFQQWRGRAAIGLAFLSIAIPLASFAARVPTPDRPLFDSINYVADADDRSAVWASLDRRPDPWTLQYLGNSPKHGLFVGIAGQYPDLEAPAPYLDQAGPELRVLSDNQDAGVRRVKLRLRSLRGAPNLGIQLSRGSQALVTSIAGVEVRRKLAPEYGITCWNVPAEGIELEIEAREAGKLDGLLLDASCGLPAVAGREFQPRSVVMVRLPNRDNESTFVKRRFSL